MLVNKTSHKFTGKLGKWIKLNMDTIIRLFYVSFIATFIEHK